MWEKMANEDGYAQNTIYEIIKYMIKYIYYGSATKYCYFSLIFY